MTARKNGGQDLFDHLALADNHPPKLIEHLRAGLAELSQVFANPVGGHR
jgi:hypothetical protein